jgi:hypothetical protein
MSQPSASVVRAAQLTQSEANSDKLQMIQSTAARARDLELEIADLNERLAEKTAALREITFNRLPALLMEAKLDFIGVPRDGNKMGVDYELKPYYSANIAAGWDEEKRDKAFALLKTLKADGLIKAEVIARLPKGNLAQAKKLVAAAKKLKITATLKQSVHSGTLTAWLKELYEDRGKSLSTETLETLGASIGTYVRVTQRKD